MTSYKQLFGDGSAVEAGFSVQSSDAHAVLNEDERERVCFRHPRSHLLISSA
ncbi:hypothetical protein [Streptomyces sp. NPDC001537]